MPGWRNFLITGLTLVSAPATFLVAGLLVWSLFYAVTPGGPHSGAGLAYIKVMFTALFAGQLLLAFAMPAAQGRWSGAPSPWLAVFLACLLVRPLAAAEVLLLDFLNECRDVSFPLGNASC